MHTPKSILSQNISLQTIEALLVQLRPSEVSKVENFASSLLRERMENSKEASWLDSLPACTLTDNEERLISQAEREIQSGKFFEVSPCSPLSIEQSLGL